MGQSVGLGSMQRAIEMPIVINSNDNDDDDGDDDDISNSFKLLILAVSVTQVWMEHVVTIQRLQEWLIGSRYHANSDQNVVHLLHK